MVEMILLSALVFAVLGNIWQATSHQRLRNVVMGAVDKASADGVQFAKIPVNQLIEMGFESRHGFWIDPKRFNHSNQTRHPATLSPWRRNKL